MDDGKQGGGKVWKIGSLEVEKMWVMRLKTRLLFGGMRRLGAF
jgi:hypothetical protein